MAPQHSLRLAVECSRLTHDVRGMGRYVRALLPRLGAQRLELQLIPFVRHRRELDALRTMLGRLGLPDDRTSLRLFDDLRSDDVDLWWYPWNTVRPAPRTGTVVATIHDVAPLAHPDPRRTRWWRNRRAWSFYRAAATRADLIIADSAFTATEIHQYLNVPLSRIRGVPLAANDLPVPSPARDADALRRLGVRAPYVLAINANDRRKNLDVLYRAMTHVIDRLPSARLVMVGKERTAARSAAPAWRHSAGFVSEDDLASLYRSAHAVVVPSLYEGFGLPVLEAMRLGAPVICARTSSLPEVGGDAARYVTATDEHELAAAIVQLFTDDALRDSQRRAGRDQASHFSWDETARLTLAAFDAALSR